MHFRFHNLFHGLTACFSAVSWFGFFAFFTFFLHCMGSPSSDPSSRLCSGVSDVAEHSIALVFVEESGVIGVVSALLAFSLVV